MGRESRQARRQRQRRQQQRQQMGTPRWAIWAGTGVIAAVIVLLALLALGPKTPLHLGSGASPTPTETPGKTIDGVGCNATEQITYHVHGHLDIYVDGQQHVIPPYIGFNVDHDCLYWMHSHAPSQGIIHVEAPHKIIPTLGNFFDVWGQPLSTSRVWKYSVKPGESMRVWVNEKPYNGNPRNIKIKPHTDVTVEIGPPWVKPQPFDYAAQQL